MRGNRTGFSDQKEALREANVPADHLTLYVGDGKEIVIIEHQTSLHAEEFALFVAAVDKGEKPSYGVSLARDSLSVSLAVLESIKTGEIITL